VLDAIRVADNVKVILKLARTESEMDISWKLGKGLLENSPDPRNRTVPLLEKIPFDKHFLDRTTHDFKGLLVFPFLRQFDDPPFTRVSEVVEALKQFLEALEFIHKKNIAHRLDFCHGNLMMDATRIVTSGWHFIAPYSHDGSKVGIDWQPRCLTGTVSYYVLDFGLSTDCTERLRLAGIADEDKYSDKFRVETQNARGQDKTIPEVKGDHNPFRVDIYQLRNVINKLMETYDGLEMFHKLAADMTKQEPGEHPTATECLRRFDELISSLSEEEICSPVAYLNSPPPSLNSSSDSGPSSGYDSGR
ncbi:hypothetical protein C8R43DRAFT_883830, partial [Mycena crocata]